ncbi:MAG: hypothetical protein PHH86_05455 [Sphaerochaetaceae bacterium]|nr:hypothetical protein [Sphaerochaetaceae bacterium]
MKREFVKEFISILTENYKNLVSSKLVRRSEGVPLVELAVLKIKMMVHVNFIDRIAHKLMIGEIQQRDLTEIDQMLKMEFDDTWQSYYSGLSRTNHYSFNLFWDQLLEYHKVSDSQRPHYINAKIQICILWQVLNQLYPTGDANSVEFYNLHPDQYEDNLPVINCSSDLLDRILGVITSEYYIPVSFDWKDSDEPAVFEMELKNRNDSLKGNTRQLGKKIMKYGDKTLGDVWTDYTISHTIHKVAVEKSLFLHQIQLDLAHSIAKFSLTQNRIIEGLCRREDFQGNTWDDAELSLRDQQELTRLRERVNTFAELSLSQQKTIESLSAVIHTTTTENADQAQTIGKYIERDLNSEKAYSNNKTERARELIGELLRETPIIIPTLKQKQEFLDCRWIISCTKTEKSRIVPSIEKAIRIWMEACQTQELGFWASSVLINGLYLLLDGELVKGKEADPNIKRKVDNAFSRSCFYKSERELVKEAISSINN